MTKHRRFSKAAKEYIQPFCGIVPAFEHGPTPEADRARFDRVFRPWPKWVLKLGAELCHVDYPTIDRDVFLQSFRVVNVAFFRLSKDWETQIFPDKKRSIFERFDFKTFSLVIASFIGHADKHFAACRVRLNEKFAKGEISVEQFEKGMRLLSQEKSDAFFRKMLGFWSNSDEAKPFELTQAVQIAREKTFSNTGEAKESQSVPIYRVMFKNWIKIEKMSGPKELAVFLTKQGKLVGFSKNPEGEIGRVATMCSRIGLKFRSKSKSFELQQQDALM